MTARVPLLLHSLSDLKELWLPCLGAASVTSLTEVGAETGITTRLLASWLADRGGGRITTIDPLAPDMAASEVPTSVEMERIRALSPASLASSRLSDAYLLDGDHNYGVLTAELEAIDALAGAEGPYPLVVLHDVGWPCARRDQYYDVSSLDPTQVHPHSASRGVRPGVTGTVRGGFRGAGEFSVALEEGGPKNGLLTAVEDFISSRPQLSLHVIQAVFGLGFIVDARHVWATDVEALLAPYTDNDFFSRQEANRIDLYLHVLALQDRIEEIDRERRALREHLNGQHADERDARLDRAVSEAGQRGELSPEPLVPSSVLR